MEKNTSEVVSSRPDCRHRPSMDPRAPSRRTASSSTSLMSWLTSSQRQLSSPSKWCPLVTTVTERAQLSIVLAKPARWASQPRATMSRSRLIAVAGRAVEQRGTVVLVEPLQLGLHAEHTAGQDHPVGHSDPTSNRPSARRTTDSARPCTRVAVGYRRSSSRPRSSSSRGVCGSRPR